MIGLMLEAIQLLWYGFGSQTWMMWLSGVLAAFASITYPAISSYVSTYADADKQGLVQGMVTGIRGLCNGLGPLVFGLIFNLFHVDLNHDVVSHPVANVISTSLNRTAALTTAQHVFKTTSLVPFIPGPPFVFGALLVFLAMLVTAFIPSIIQYKSSTSFKLSSDLFGIQRKSSTSNSSNSHNNYYYTNVELTAPGKRLDFGADHSPNNRSMKEPKGSDSESICSDSNDNHHNVSSSSPSKSKGSKVSSNGHNNPRVEVTRPRGKGRTTSTCELNMPLLGPEAEPT